MTVSDNSAAFLAKIGFSADLLESRVDLVIDRFDQGASAQAYPTATFCRVAPVAEAA
ncbi:hypothetical protein [Amycolatopsis sp. H20-H5]|uniref:hypothetical protein n=1 Tax=Amycolatopsis sp. H20-H5 TaxID=3046309 RepID=UPI002DB9D4ED|nr:hypothetical protein [Amycolatopsis sp. H20-H5]MEC3976946.1 hypothetical protein [Amycolatopsis sp. H20-H5]